jgi:hypothetical protein
VSILSSPSTSPVRRRTSDYFGESRRSSLNSPLPNTPNVHGGSPTTTAVIDAALPSVKEIRRFSKKCSQLNEIVWGGRGGQGAWCLRRTKGLVKVEAITISELQEVERSGERDVSYRMASAGLPQDAVIGVERKRRTSVASPVDDRFPPLGAGAQLSTSTSSNGPEGGRNSEEFPTLCDPPEQQSAARQESPTPGETASASYKKMWPSITSSTGTVRERNAEYASVARAPAPPGAGSTFPFAVQRKVSITPTSSTFSQKTSTDKSTKPPAAAAPQRAANTSASAASSSRAGAHVPGGGKSKRKGKAQNRASEASSSRNGDGVTRASSSSRSSTAKPKKRQ